MQEVFEKIIERLENEVFSAELYGEKWNGQTVTNLLCLGNVRDVIEQAAAEYNNGWISVESGILPKQNEAILATVIFHGEIIIATITYFPDWLKGEQRMIAWQPLPASYQQEGGQAIDWSAE